MRGVLILLSTVVLAQTPASQTPPKSTATPARRTGAQTTASRTKPATEPPLVTDEQKTIYALGLSVYRSLSQFDLSPAELDIVKRAMTDAASKKPAEELDTWGPRIQPLAQARASAIAQREKTASSAYLAKAAQEPGAIKTDSGMIYKELRPGTGPSPKPTDTVKVNYRGTLVDGTEFDSSYKRHEPAQFALNAVIPCWTEGVGKMKVGGKAMLVCPSNLAYGEQGRPSIPGGAALIFEVELIEIAGANH